MDGLQEIIMIADLLDYMKYLDAGWEKKGSCFMVCDTFNHVCVNPKQIRIHDYLENTV